MVSVSGDKISSPPSAVIEIVTNVSSTQNGTSLFDDSKELERSNRSGYKGSSSTQTSSSSSLLHKRKANSYVSTSSNSYAYRTLMANQMMTILHRPKTRNHQINSTTQRILSAKFLRIKQLQSELTEAHKKITDLQNENRTLKIIYKRQDSALRKYESQDSYLPQLLKSHEEETRVLNLKYKKIRGSYNDLESRYNRQFTELNTVKDRYKQLLQISQDKHLLERERLTKQIEEMQILVNDLKNKIKLQARRLDLEVKNCKYQLSVEFRKQKILREQLKQLQDGIEKTKSALEEKERLIAVYTGNNYHVISKNNYPKLNKASTISNSLKSITAIRNRESIKNASVPDNNVTTEDKITPSKMNDETTEPSSVPCTNVPEAATEIHTSRQTEHCTSPKNDDSLNMIMKERSIELLVKAGDDNDDEEDDDDDKNNNNRKWNSLVSVNPLIPPRAAHLLKKSQSLESFEDCEKALVDEGAGSETSDDFKRIEDATSWLEVHEKSNHGDTSEETTENNSQDSQNTLFSSDFDDIIERTRNAISVKMETDLNFIESQSVITQNTLTEDKKTQLLQALEAIDLGVHKKPPLSKPMAVNKVNSVKSNVKFRKKVN